MTIDAPQIFAQLGLSSKTVSLLATGVVGIVMFLATIPAVLYVDKLGRKPVLIVGAIGMAISHLIVAGISGSFQDSWPEHRGGGWAAVVMVVSLHLSNSSQKNTNNLSELLLLFVWACMKYFAPLAASILDATSVQQL